MCDYSLQAFMHRETAVERAVDLDQIRLSIANLLALHGFNIQLAGYKFLISLITHYIVKSDYSEEATIEIISKVNGTYPKFVTDCMTSCIRNNDRFIDIAAVSLGNQVHKLPQKPTIADVVEIIGALFNIYYNYTVSDETIHYKNAINFNRICF